MANEGRVNAYSIGTRFMLEKAKTGISQNAFAEREHLNASTVQSYVEYARSVDEVETLVPGAKDKILTGFPGCGVWEFKKFKRMQPEQKRETAEAIANGVAVKIQYSSKRQKIVNAIAEEMRSQAEARERTVEDVTSELLQIISEAMRQVSNTIECESTLMRGTNAYALARALVRLGKSICDEIKRSEQGGK